MTRLGCEPRPMLESRFAQSGSLVQAAELEAADLAAAVEPAVFAGLAETAASPAYVAVVATSD